MPSEILLKGETEYGPWGYNLQGNSGMIPPLVNRVDVL
jgi:hypothetical protein